MAIELSQNGAQFDGILERSNPGLRGPELMKWSTGERWRERGEPIQNLAIQGRVFVMKQSGKGLPGKRRSVQRAEPDGCIFLIRESARAPGKDMGDLVSLTRRVHREERKKHDDDNERQGRSVECLLH